MTKTGLLFTVNCTLLGQHRNGVRHIFFLYYGFNVAVSGVKFVSKREMVERERDFMLACMRARVRARICVCACVCGQPAWCFMTAHPIKFNSDIYIYT